MERLPIKILQSMFDHKKHADIQLISGKDGKKISAHKIVLSTATEYFDLMLNGSDREVSQTEVLVPNIKSDVLEAVIKFIYHGSIAISDYGAAIELLKTSHLMKIPELLSYSSDYLKQHISVEICLEVYLLALQFELEDLTKHVTSSILKDLKSISKQQDFKQLDKESLVNIINSRNESSCEDDIAEAVLIWIGDEADRFPYFKELLKLLKINHLRREFIIHQLLKKCEDQDETNFMLNEFKIKTNFILNEWKNIKKSQYSFNRLKLIGIEKKALQYIFYKYDLEPKTRSILYTAYNYGQILGFWDDKIVFLNKSIITVIDIQEGLVSSPIKCSINESTEVKFKNTHKLGNHIYLVNRSKCVRLRLWDFQLDTISPPDNEDKYIFDSFCEFHGELKMAAYKKDDPNICLIIGYNPDNDSWDYGTEVLLYQLKERGTMAAHDNQLYYFKREFLHIYNPNERVWRVPIKLEQLITDHGLLNVYSSIEQAYSINGQLIVRNIRNELLRYSNGELTKLNVEGDHSKIIQICLCFTAVDPFSIRNVCDILWFYFRKIRLFLKIYIGNKIDYKLNK